VIESAFFSATTRSTVPGLLIRTAQLDVLPTSGDMAGGAAGKIPGGFSALFFVKYIRVLRIG
jgi:hypothetical protein